MARQAPAEDPAQDAPEVGAPKHAAAGLPALLHTARIAGAHPGHCVRVQRAAGVRSWVMRYGFKTAPMNTTWSAAALSATSRASPRSVSFEMRAALRFASSDHAMPGHLPG